MHYRVVIFCSFLLLSAVGRGYSASFNKQRVDRFDWKIVSTEHFDVYYYEDAEPLL
ncbi:MAG: hypothetical protein GF397_04595, partial [Elusimicrobia bacterium]|nr:hypothetical protein [Elusimicrobiota bacterium]